MSSTCQRYIFIEISHYAYLCFFSFETMFNSSSMNLYTGVDGGLYTATICSFVGSEIFTASILQSQFSTISSGMKFLFIMSATLPPALLQSCQNIDTSCFIPIILG